MLKATLRLFKAVPIKSRLKNDPDSPTLAKTIPLGYVLDTSIESTQAMLKTINKHVGLSGEQANATFHKSWEKVRSADIEQLVLEQIMHYVTTYGFAEYGIYSPSTVYIPAEKLDLPLVTDSIPLTYIRGLTAPELLAEIVKLGSGVALHEDSLNDIMTDR